jgi:hypothetical protein
MLIVCLIGDVIGTIFSFSKLVNKEKIKKGKGKKKIKA